MNKNTWIVLVLIIIIVLVGGFFLAQRSSKGSISSQNSQHSASTTSPSSPVVVTPLEQNVYHSKPDTQKEEQIKTAASTTEGDTIRTSATGRALIEAPSAHPTILDYNSELAIITSKDNGNQTVMELFGGQLWSRAKKSAEKGEFFEIKTGNAVASVRGTSFGLSYGNNKTTLVVATGTVFIYKKDPKTGEPILDSEEVVTAGKKAIVQGDGPPAVSDQTAEDKKEKWFTFNASADGIVIPPSDTNAANGQPSALPKKASPLNPPANHPKSPKTQPVTQSGGSISAGGTSAPAAQSSTASIFGISPKSIQAGDNQTFVTLRGKGFLNVHELTVAEDVPPDFAVVNDATIQFHIGNLVPGTYDIYFLMKDDTYVNFPGWLVITSPRATSAN